MVSEWRNTKASLVCTSKYMPAALRAVNGKRATARLTATERDDRNFILHSRFLLPTAPFCRVPFCRAWANEPRKSLTNKWTQSKQLSAIASCCMSYFFLERRNNSWMGRGSRSHDESSVFASLFSSHQHRSWSAGAAMGWLKWMNRLRPSTGQLLLRPADIITTMERKKIPQLWRCLCCVIPATDY